jgi:hypothetical protein
VEGDEESMSVNACWKSLPFITERDIRRVLVNWEDYAPMATSDSRNLGEAEFEEVKEESPSGTFLLGWNGLDEFASL